MVSCNGGCTIEADVFVEFSNLSGCWAAASIGITKTAYPEDGSGYTGEYPDGAFMSISSDGDACWMTPSNLRRHAYFWLGIYAEDGTKEYLPNWSINADKYVNGWHTLRIVINSDRTVKFYADNDLIWQPSKKIHPTVLEGRNIVLGSRSSGSAGKAYHDWVRVTTP
ncbi:MAG: hypothetical protein ACK4TF_07990 [Thermodesulfovibrionales bacterium]